jgi:hemolysin III
MSLINFNAGQNLPDGGLWYSETNPTHTIMEPFNAASALVFVGIALWWLIQLRGQFAQRTFLYVCAVILLVGAVGGSIYHAFRYSAIFIYMDWVPILVLCLMASTYFLFRLMASIKWALLIIGLIMLIQVVIWNYGNVNGHYNINTNYALMAATVLGPILLYLRKQKFRHGHLVVGAFSAFLFALLFRIVDYDKWLSIGTHFLWHLFGALTCHLLFLYVYYADEPKAEKAPKSISTHPITHNG